MGNNVVTGAIKAAWQLPHPPVVVPEVGRGREKEISKTLESMRIASDSIINSGADTIIIFSPHAPAYREQIAVNGYGALKGDLSRFGARKAAVAFEGDAGLSDSICKEALKAGIRAIPAGGPERGSQIFRNDRGELDHGTVVPMYFVNEAIKKTGAVMPKLVVISIAFLDNRELYEFGRSIARAVITSGVNAAIITSGDLSHKLTEDGPYGYNPAGPEFDGYILECIEQSDVERLLNTDPVMLEQAAQCGFYGLLMLYGAISGDLKDSIGGGAPEGAANNEGEGAAPRVISYEGVLGVGYAIARIL